jgi:hypothetical protein
MKSAFQNGIAIDEQNEVDRDIARQQHASLEWIEKALCNSEPNLAGGGNSSGRISAARGQSSRGECCFGCAFLRAGEHLSHTLHSSPPPSISPAGLSLLFLLPFYLARCWSSSSSLSCSAS